MPTTRSVRTCSATLSSPQVRVSGYHLPSRQELTGVFSYIGQVNYGNFVNYSNVNEACQFGNIKETFKLIILLPVTVLVTPLRFKQATGSPSDGSSDDFPFGC